MVIQFKYVISAQLVVMITIIIEIIKLMHEPCNFLNHICMQWSNL